MDCNLKQVSGALNPIRSKFQEKFILKKGIMVYYIRSCDCGITKHKHIGIYTTLTTCTYESKIFIFHTVYGFFKGFWELRLLHGHPHVGEFVADGIIPHG